jgi:ABC-type branched-subunit amino acid transport system substrate-binding protein
MRQLHRRVLSAVTILFALTGALPAHADEEGVTADTIWFGQAAALAGPSAALGQGMRHGILAAFEQVNAAGGIHGRKLKLVSRDDGYDPDRSLYQTKRLLEQDKVFALIGAVGTPSTISTISVSGPRNVPLIGPFSGAEFLRSSDVRNVINIRASYAAEAEVWIHHLTEDLQYKRIAIFYQDDSFGRDVLRGVKRALDKRGLELAAEGTFERNTRAVSSALRTIERAEPEAVIMVGTYGPCAEFIKLAHKRDFSPTFVAVSFVGANALARELGAEGNGVIVSQVVPFPWDTSLQVVADYQAAEKAIDPTLTPDFVSLEGYLSGRLAAAALDIVGPNPTRATLLQAIRDVGRFDFGGHVITIGDRTRDEPPKVFLTVIQPDGTFKPVDRLARDSVQEVGLQELFLRSTVTDKDKPEAGKAPDLREEANARAPDCTSDADRASAQCEQGSTYPVAAVQTTARQDKASWRKGSTALAAGIEPNPRIEPTPDPKAQARTQQAAQQAKAQQAKAEAKAQAKAEAEAKAQAQADAKAQAKAKAKADAEAQAQAKADAKARAKADAEAQAQAKADAKALAKADAEAQAQAKADAKAQAKADAEAKAQAKADAKAQAKADAEAKAQAKAQTKAGTAEADAQASLDRKPATTTRQPKGQAKTQAMAEVRSRPTIRPKTESRAESKGQAKGQPKASPAIARAMARADQKPAKPLASAAAYSLSSCSCATRGF